MDELDGDVTQPLFRGVAFFYATSLCVCGTSYRARIQRLYTDFDGVLLAKRQPQVVDLVRERRTIHNISFDS